MNRSWIILVVVYILSFSFSVHRYTQLPLIVEDSGKLLPTSIKQIRSATDERSLQEWIQAAAKQGEKISVAGMQHSQGGHTYYPGGIMIDMKSYDKILAYHPEEKMIRVQSGITWEKIQQHINPDGLAIRVMQSQNIFTVGGSLSVNVHGRDIRYGSLLDSVESFRLLQADGSIIEVSRTQHPELFNLVIGGYGLFGIILDVTLKLTDDELYQMYTHKIDYKDYASYFKEKVRANPAIRMHIARISVAPESFLKEMYVTNYLLYEDQSLREKYQPLKKETIIALPKFLLGLSRYSDWGKQILWDTQLAYFQSKNGDLITRNNVMRSESQFMEYENANRTEVLQEYFVPVDEFASYIDDLRKLLKREDLNLLNITIRYVEEDEQAVLSYAKEDMFALVLLINQGRSAKEVEKTQKVLRQMIDVTLDHRGSYYLPYYPYPTKEQLHRAYPRAKEFFEKKRHYDPDEVFVNLFYKEYGK
jgi:FAD/FMN-containing dehydrogenase